MPFLKANRTLGRRGDGAALAGNKAAVPARGILIGALLALAINVLDAYATIVVRGSYMTLNFSTAAALFFFFFVGLASLLVALIRKPLALDQAELVTIYLMMMVACCIPCMGFTQFIIPSLVGPTYYATPENDWNFLYNQHVPSWMVPQGDTVARYFFEGLPQGESIPWQPWLLPLTCWYSFFLVLSLGMVCGMVILRKQWMERERLIFPLVQVPMEIIQQEGDRTGEGGFFSQRLMWLGFAFALVMLSINGLHFYFPYFPTINRFASLLLFRNTVSMDLWFNPAWIGFFYFVKLDVSASIWVFYLVATLQRGLFNTIGLQSTERLDEYSLDPYTAHQGMGAMIVFVLIGLWWARQHLAKVGRKAFLKDPQVDDSGEIIPYRLAVFGLLGSALLVAWALWMTGMPPLVVPVFMFGAAVIFLSLTRAVVEGGVPTMRPPVTTASFVVSGVGTSPLGAQGLVALGFTYGWHAELRSFVMSSVANGLKMGEVIRGDKGRLFWATLIAILVSLAGSTYMTFYLSYKYGGINLNPLFYGWGAAMMGANNMATRIAEGAIGPRLDAWFFRGVGGALMGLLMWARHRFLWWPLSPLGYMLSANWKTGHIFLSAFLGWLLKCVILKYGGIRLYQNARPFFMGMILGEIVAAGSWLLIDFMCGRTGNFLTKP
jgi:hypothetical protein